MIAKATRLLVLGSAPFGVVGTDTDFGSVSVKPDYAINEMLMGLRYLDFDLSGVETITAAEVIRVGFNADADDFNTDREDDIDAAIAAAWDWVTTALDGFGFA